MAILSFLVMPMQMKKCKPVAIQGPCSHAALALRTSSSALRVFCRLAIARRCCSVAAVCASSLADLARSLVINVAWASLALRS